MGEQNVALSLLSAFADRRDARDDLCGVLAADLKSMRALPRHSNV